VLIALATIAAVAATSGQITYADTHGDLFRSGADAKGATVVVPSDGASLYAPLAISPDGANVLAAETGDQPRLTYIRLSDGSRRPIAGTDDASSGSLSPDARTVVFAKEGGIFTVALAGGTATRLVPAADGTEDSLPQYSPDGKLVAFVRTTADASDKETGSLEIVPVAGGTPTVLANGVYASFPDGGRLAFSPDGRRIAYAGDIDNPGVFVVSVTGGDTTRLTSDLDYWPVYAPDSTIFFARYLASDNADSNQDMPVDPVDNDLYELWTVQDGGGTPALVAEGDFEAVAVAPAIPTAPPPTTGGPGPDVVAQVPTQKVAAVITAGGFAEQVSCAQACRITATLLGRLPQRRSLSATAKVYGRGTLLLPHGGRSKLFVHINAAAKKGFARAGSFRLTLRTMVQSATGRRVSSQQVSFTT